MKPPLSLVPALPVAAGVVISIWLSSLGCGDIALVGGIVGFIILYVSGLHYPSACFAMCAIGAASCLLHKSEIPPSALLDVREAAYYGCVEKVREMPTGQQVILRVEAAKMASDSCMVSIRNPFKCLLRRYASEETLLPGDRLAFIARIEPLPGTTGVPGEVDYTAGLKRAGVTCVAIVKDDGLKIVEYAGGMQQALNNMRTTLAQSIVTAPISGDTSGFLLAAILGDGEYLLYDAREAYRATGTAHILALSGLHVGILVSLLSFIFFPIRTFKYSRQIESFTSIIIIWTYVVIVGMSPSVQRAAVMLSVYLLARALQGRIVPLNTLLLALAVVLVIDPSSIASPALHLSFAAVGAIMLFMWLLPEDLPKHKCLYWIANFVGLPVAAMMGTSLVSAFYFGYFPTLFLFANIIVALFFPTLLGLGVLMMLLNLLGIAPDWLGVVLDFLFGGMDASVRFVCNLRIPNITGININQWIILPYTLSIICGALAIHTRHTWWHRHSMAKGFALASLSFFIMIAPMHLLLKEHSPISAMYIPRTSPQGVILTHGNMAVVIPLCPDEYISRLKDDYDRRYYRLLAMRRSDEFEVICGDFEYDMFEKQGCVLTAGDKKFALIGNAAIPTTNIKADYAVVSNSFTGHVRDIVEAVCPDTLMISASVHPSRAARLRRECADSIPVIDLRRGFFTLDL